MEWFLIILGVIVAFGLAATLAAQTAPTFPFSASTINNTLPNTIKLKFTGFQEEALSSSATSFYPGSLVTLQSDGSVVPHAVYGGGGEQNWAFENALSGAGLLDAYANTDLVFYGQARNGDHINALLAPGQNVVVGQDLISLGDGQVGALPGGTGLQLYQNVADSTAVANTTAETAFDKSFKIPANFLQVGDVIKIKGLVSAIGVTGTPTLRTRLELVDDAASPTTITVMDTSTKSVIASDFVEFEATIVIRTLGVAGTMVAEGWFVAGTPNSTTAVPNAFQKASTTIKTNQAQTVQVTATWSAASASNTALLSVLSIELQREMKSRGKALKAVDNSLGTTFAYVPIRTL